MTMRKCGTCRFYGVGTQQTHGSCRNPAYPRRDDVALLRPDECGCRSGWDKDYWEPRDGAVVAAGVSQDAVTERIAVPARGTLVAPLNLPERPLAPAASLADSDGGAPPGARRRGFQGPAVAAPGANGGESAIKLDPTLEGHPELNPDGTPIRRTSRTAVAEAHRRALARREQERLASVERGTVRPPERRDPLPVPAPVQPEKPILPERPTVTFKPEEPPREVLREEVRPTPAPTPVPPPAPAPTPIPEAIDRHISTAEVVMHETPREPLPPVQPVGIEPAPPSPPAPPEATAGRQAPIVPETAAPPPAPPASESRYWDQQPATGRFGRLREPLTEGPPVRTEGWPIQPIGRRRPEPTAPVERPTERTIRPLGRPGASPESPRAELTTEAPRPTTPPVEPRQVAGPAAPPPPEVAPRQIDDALLRQLESDWRTQAAAAHGEQRCGTCRFFQASDGGRGSCGCAFTEVYRRPVEPQDLGCLTSLGSWWAATDEGWLERAERRPRRATPLLDALMREHEAAEAARNAPERRRAR